MHKYNHWMNIKTYHAIFPYLRRHCFASLCSIRAARRLQSWRGWGWDHKGMEVAEGWSYLPGVLGDISSWGVARQHVVVTAAPRPVLNNQHWKEKWKKESLGVCIRTCNTLGYYTVFPLEVSNTCAQCPGSSTFYLPHVTDEDSSWPFKSTMQNQCSQ